jgi:hypothetical protein
MQILKNLFEMGITVGLSDRQAFVKKMAGLIEEYQKNPEQAEEWAKGLIKYLEEIKEDFRLQRNISASSDSTKESIEELTKAVQELTKQLQEKKE